MLNAILKEFLKIAEIPHASHHEEKISRYLYDWAVSRGLSAVQDEYKNVIIDKPAAQGFEEKPGVIFQAHMDMVAVADEGVEFDPVHDPIRVINDGRKLTAKGTSLGADDGIGVAICLYLLQDNTLQHGPVRAIFTANEEDGMDSRYLDPKYLEGRYLINLDEETIGSLCNACAGGDTYYFTRRAEWMEMSEGTLFTISLKNLLGGHSGMEIHKGHANALVTLASFLSELSLHGLKYNISAYTGGQAQNAIPKSASVSFIADNADAGKIADLAEQFTADFHEGFRNIETEYTFDISFSKLAEPVSALTAELSGDLAKLIVVIPNNIHTMSPFIDGLVESSANLGLMKIDKESVEIQSFARSSAEYYADQIRMINSVLAPEFGFELKSDDHIPGWAVNPNSRLTCIACEEYKKLTGKEMTVNPIHAGVECGVFAGKNPDLDMISIGPTLFDVHTPKESCILEDVETITKLVIEILKTISGQ